jgi:hypothetical protein
MKVALPKDLEQDARLAKRSHAELCRQKRIFNARDRIIGVRRSGRFGKRAAGEERRRRLGRSL